MITSRNDVSELTEKGEDSAENMAGDFRGCQWLRWVFSTRYCRRHDGAGFVAGDREFCAAEAGEAGRFVDVQGV